MTPEEVHQACHEAMTSCPQFSAWDDDQRFSNWPEDFGSIPKLGMRNVINFWRIHGTLLWKLGYDAELPDEVLTLFD